LDGRPNRRNKAAFSNLRCSANRIDPPPTIEAEILSLKFLIQIAYEVVLAMKESFAAFTCTVMEMLVEDAPAIGLHNNVLQKKVNENSQNLLCFSILDNVVSIMRILERWLVKVENTMYSSSFVRTTRYTTFKTISREGYVILK